MATDLPKWLGGHSVWNDIAGERIRQIEKWGEQHHDDAWWCVIEMEELGEVARAVYEMPERHRPNTLEALRAELVQVAAVAIAWIEDIDGRG